MPFTDFLPGTDPSRSTVNTLQFLQKLGVPTGTLPDGSPNLMNFYMKAIHKGAHQEQTENGVSDTTTVTTGGIAISQTKPR
jgi:hypothetical protein